MNWKTKKRQALWDLECCKAHDAGRGETPICNICDLPVLPGHAWDESHAPEHPEVFGGTSTAIAHALCNRRHGASVVRPMVTHGKNVRARFTGAYVPRHVMAGSRRSRLKKKLDGTTVVRSEERADG